MEYNYFDEKREKTPWNELEENWIKRGRWTLQRIYDNIPFLKKRYQEAGISPSDIKSVEDFQKIPYMTKQDFLDSFPDKLVVGPKEDLIRMHATSGTSGHRPTCGFYNQTDLDNWTYLCARNLGAIGMTKKDVFTLWNALKHGFVDVIASDHAPHSLKEKNGASVWESKPGIPGLETTLPLLLTQINEGRLSLEVLMKATAEEPANIFHLSNRGSLVEGNWADLVVVDMKRDYKIDASVFFSKAKYSPFDGIQVKGKPVKTFVNGKLVMDEGEIVACLKSE